MNNKQKNILTAVFLIGNLVFWSFVVFPTFVKFYQILTKPPSLSVDSVPHPQTAGQNLQRINFYNLRDPFMLPVPKAEKRKKKKKISRSIRKKNTSGPYVSAFKLNSIVQLEGRNFASLQKKEASTPNRNQGNPYSYRFGSNPVKTARTENVFEGDVIDGEKVVKITKDSVILSKDGQYYQLTFSGGFPVSKPKK